MHWADRAAVFIVAALALAAVPACATEPLGYGQVETFQPGKKYNCLPTPDHKGWDCKEIGKADIPAHGKSEPKPPPQKLAQPEAPVSAPAAAAPPSPKPASELPSYLTNAAARNHSSAPTRSTIPQRNHVDNVAPPSNPLATMRPAAAAPVARPQPAPARTVPIPASSAQSISPSAPTPEPNPSNHGSVADFLALPGNHYVIELAHAFSESDTLSARNALPPLPGKTYVLHLHQNDADQWLLVWGNFDDVDAARAARADVPTSIRPGWPRPIMPLQTEVRRAQE